MSKALELAKIAENRSGLFPVQVTSKFYLDTAAELRRQHEEIEALRMQLNQENLARLSCMEIRSEIASENEALRQRVAELADRLEDADRYRWLCSHTIVPSPSLWDKGVAFLTPMFERKRGAMDKDELDAAIDKARKVE